MVADTIALIYDTGVPAVLSTVIILLYLVMKLCGWLVDNFHAIPDKAEGQKIMSTPGRNQDTQGATKRSQSSEESKSTDTRHKAFPTVDGIRVRTTTA